VKKIQEINIEDFDYPLPDEKIARHPLERRSDSRLLYYRDGEIEDQSFRDIVALFRSDDLWIVNNTRVIPARIKFTKSTGATIEIFCLEPLQWDYTQALSQTTSVRWKCFVGGAKKWKEGPLFHSVVIEDKEIILSALCLEKVDNAFYIEFNWEGATFSEILDAIGELPIPPYLNRDTEPEDYDRYQTLFAELSGSVAAPTASLHFDQEILSQLKEKGVQQQSLTLHVGAGTFKPVNTTKLGEHIMHAEYFEVSQSLISAWINQWKNNGRIIVVGTTALRTLESIFWLAHENLSPQEDGLYHIDQWLPYQITNRKDRIQILEQLLMKMKSEGLEKLVGTTQILMGPSYTIQSADVLITNFHQPKSTLLLLVHAAVGEDWKKIYNHALTHDYRFLSYGDSSWLAIKKAP
jgi:S-adenosylmethionine:tRNA ribosyltransferase-isomerase